jgi:succinylglutamate desuccinylase
MRIEVTMSNLFAPYSDLLEHTLKHEGMFEARELSLRSASLNFLDLGVIELLPKTPRQRGVILSAGIHGNETAPIELLNNLVNGMLNSQCLELGRPTLIIFGHPQAMREGERFVEFNMNRLFMGQCAKQEYSASNDAQRAQKLELVVSGFCARHDVGEHYDLHTAIRASEYERFALKPLLKQPQKQDPTTASKGFLRSAGIQAIVQQNTYANTFSSYTANQFGLESYTLELGKVRGFGQNDLLNYKNTMAALKNLVCAQAFSTDASEMDYFEVCHEIIVPDESFALHIKQEQANFGTFKKGTCIWESDAQSYVVSHDEEFIIFPNPDVPIGQRAGLMLIKTRDPAEIL